jgi:hypothetical protein
VNAVLQGAWKFNGKSLIRSNSEVVDHCYGPGPHARGCWVIDLILSKN